jgi:hypothetical protein
MNSPYRKIPSKKGTFPKGILTRRSGSGIAGICLKIPARTTINPTMKVRKLRTELLGSKDCISISFIVIFLICFSFPVQGNCVGRFVNPITDICWKCVFPLTIMGMDVVQGNASPPVPRSPVCVCNRPPLNLPVPGIPVGFWEPVRLVDVTRTPYCLVNMGGLQIANSGISYRGDVEENTDDGTHHSFYQVHWYVYPIMYWLEVLMDFVCLENASIDLAYLLLRPANSCHYAA